MCVLHFHLPEKIEGPAVTITRDYRHWTDENLYYLGQRELEERHLGSTRISKVTWSSFSGINARIVRYYSDSARYDQLNLNYHTGTGKKGAVSRKDFAGYGREIYDYENGNLKLVDFPSGIPDLSRSINTNGTINWEQRNGVRRTYSWDDDLRLTAINQPDDNISIVFTSKTVTVSQGDAWLQERYDDWGRLERTQTRMDGSSVLSTHSHSYDDLGRRIGETVPGGAVYSIEYDIWDRITKREATNADDDSDMDYDTESNGTTEVKTRRNQSVDTETRHDALGRWLSGSLGGHRVTYSYNGPDLTISPQSQGSRTMDHDLRGRKTDEDHPETGTLRYGYNAASWLTSLQKPEVTFTFTYDGAGRPDQTRIGSRTITDRGYHTGFGTLNSAIHESERLNYTGFDASGRPDDQSIQTEDGTPGEPIWPTGTLTAKALQHRPYLTWNDASSGYQLELNHDGQSIRRQTSGTTLTFNELGIQPTAGDDWFWRVRGVENGDSSPWSSWHQVTISGGTGLYTVGWNWHRVGFCGDAGVTNVGSFVRWQNNNGSCSNRTQSSGKASIGVKKGEGQ